MAWVWYERFDTRFAPAEFDYSSPVNAVDAMSLRPLDPARGAAVFRTGSKLANFQALHCPPFGSPPAVDDEWRDIILRFVPSDLVQFYPTTLVARDGISRKYHWVIPLARVRCIDPIKSDVVSKVEKPGITFIISCRYYVHRENCLGDTQLARDEQQPNHIVLSNALRDALASTGEYSMFYQPGDLPLVGKRELH